MEATLTNSAPICLRNSSSSSVGLAEVCAQSLMPGRTLVHCCRGAARRGETPAALSAPPIANLTNSLRSGENPVLGICSSISLSHLTCPLKREPQRKLNYTRKIELAADRPRMSHWMSAADGVRLPELNPVEEIEDLRAKLQIDLLGDWWF